MPSRADLHVHTKYSGLARLGFLRFPESVNEPRDVVKQANSTGLQVVCITDHNTIHGGLKASETAKDFPGTEVVVGEEVSTSDGEIIGLFLNEDVPRGLSAAETIERIRSQGGLAIAPHPFSMHVPALGLKVDQLDLDALEILNAGHVDGYANKKAADHCRSGRWAKVAGSDSHALNTIGCAYTLFEGSGAEDLRREILAKRTDVGGEPMPMYKVVAWSMGVTLASDRLILRSFFGGLDDSDSFNPTLSKVKEISTGKKLLALIGSLIYFTPPVPFLVGMIGQRRVRIMNSVPVHEEIGSRGLL